VTSQVHGPVISAMLAVEDTPKAVEWYKRALGATELWVLGSVGGLEIEGAPFFLAQPARNGWESPTKLGVTSARLEVFCDDPDSLIARALEAGATGRGGARRKALGPGGVLVLVGAWKQGGAAIFLRILNALVRSRVFQQRVKFFVAKQDPRDLPFLSGLLETGKLTPRIDRTYPLTEGAEAVRYVGTGQARAKVVITMS